MNEHSKITIEIGRSLEKKGQIDAAVSAFLRVGAVEEASRALMSVQRFGDAGHLLMDSLGVGISLLGGLDPERKKLALKAAVCFSQAGEAKRSADIYVALGDRPRAAEILERAGDQVGAARLRAGTDGRGGLQQAARGAAQSAPHSQSQSGEGTTSRATAQRLEQGGQLQEALQAYLRLRALPDAARVAHAMGRFADAAQIFEEAGMAYEAGVCFLKCGDTGRCLASLAQMPPDHPRYRASAVQAIRLATDLKALDFKIDQFLQRFIKDGPQDDHEVEAFYNLAKLYRDKSFLENARDLYQRILSKKGPYRDVTERLASIDQENAGSAMSFEAIVREDAAFRAAGDARQASAPQQRAAPPVFPDLPDLPPLEPRSGTVAMARPAANPAQGATVNPYVPHAAADAAPHYAGGPPSPSGAVAATFAAPGPLRPFAPLAATVEPPSTSGPSTFGPDGDLLEGAIVARRYRVERKLGQGGMAAVYRAADLELGESVAIKLFGDRTDEHLISRFKQELSLSRKLAHPNIVRLHDMGTHEGFKFITMELLEGSDLGAVSGGKPLELGRGIKYMIQACQGLAVAHEAGIIHRDIKPENFFVTSADVLKVMDFGIAKGNEKTKLTVAGFVAGTPAYMSPEQINNFTTVTHLSDMYALGVVAYEIFTGAVPFDASELIQILRKHLMDEPVPPRTKNPAIPNELEYVILRLLEKEPANRIQSCRDLASYLQELLPRARVR